MTNECEESSEQQRPCGSERNAAHDVSRIMNAQVYA